MAERSIGLLRERGEKGAPVTAIELFVDLVYALAITQLTDGLLHDLTLAGAGRSLLLLLAVWWTWNYTAWFTNYFDPETLPVRLVLVGLMLASLVMSGSLPQAFGADGLAFAAAYVAIQIVRTAYAVTVLGRHALAAVFQRAVVWWSATSLRWLIGGFAHGDVRVALWAAAIAAFISSVALWAAYFNQDAEAGRLAIARAADPGRLGVSAFGYFDIPILAGIVVAAAADAVTIARPTINATFTSVALIVGGPALFLLRSALYGRTLNGMAPTHRLAGLEALAVLAPAAIFLSQLGLLTGATAIVLSVGIWDLLAPRSKPFRQGPG